MADGTLFPYFVIMLLMICAPLRERVEYLCVDGRSFCVDTSLSSKSITSAVFRFERLFGLGTGGVV